MESGKNASFSQYYKYHGRNGKSYFQTNWRFILCLTCIYVLAVTITFHIYATSIKTLVNSEGYSYRPSSSTAEDHVNSDKDQSDDSSSATSQFSETQHHARDDGDEYTVNQAKTDVNIPYSQQELNYAEDRDSEIKRFKSDEFSSTSKRMDDSDIPKSQGLKDVLITPEQRQQTLNSVKGQDNEMRRFKSDDFSTTIKSVDDSDITKSQGLEDVLMTQEQAQRESNSTRDQDNEIKRFESDEFSSTSKKTNDSDIPKSQGPEDLSLIPTQGEKKNSSGDELNSTRVTVKATEYKMQNVSNLVGGEVGMIENHGLNGEIQETINPKAVKVETNPNNNEMPNISTDIETEENGQTSTVFVDESLTQENAKDHIISSNFTSVKTVDPVLQKDISNDSFAFVKENKTKITDIGNDRIVNGSLLNENETEVVRKHLTASRDAVIDPGEETLPELVHGTLQEKSESQNAQNENSSVQTTDEKVYSENNITANHSLNSSNSNWNDKVNESTDSGLNAFAESKSELNCKGNRIHLSETSLPYVALASFPGSGNTWVRHLIHQATGIATGSIYTDGWLQKAGFIGEMGCRNNHTACIVEKTHEWPSTDGVVYDRAVLLIRNPYDALLSYFKFTKVGHLEDMDVKIDDIEGEWQIHLAAQAKSWLNFYYKWITEFENMEELLVYENLKSNIIEEVDKLCSFLDRVVDETDKQCIQKNLEGYFHRRHTLNEDINRLYTSDVKREIDSYVFNITQLINNRFPGVSLPWGINGTA